MDFETLFTLVLVIVYVIYQIVGSRGVQNKPSPRPEQSPRPKEPQRAPGGAGDELDQALREIRQALGMEPPSPPEPAPQTARTEHEPMQEAHDRPEPPRPLAPWADVEAETVSTGAELEQSTAPWIEDSFETQPQALGEDSLLEEVEVKVLPASASVSRRPQLLRRLREPGTARDAVILSEILGPPRSRRR